VDETTLPRCLKQTVNELRCRGRPIRGGHPDDEVEKRPPVLTREVFGY
jgi:hypothetical protein